ncbi:MAG: hypothetical protein RSC89_03795, partial [Oscillospiraceae bacterium]
YTSQTYGAKASIRAENGKLMVGSYQLVGDAAYTNLKAGVGIIYTADSRAFTVTITIIGQETTLRTQTFQVTPVNNV